MFILTIRTDKPDSEIGLFDDGQKLGYKTWQAHRQLAETIHLEIQKLLEASGKGFSQLQGVVVFKGPGSFTGLRIGISVANALAYGLNIPVVSAEGEDWVEQSREHLQKGENEVTAMPEYGAAPHITQQRK